MIARYTENPAADGYFPLAMILEAKGYRVIPERKGALAVAVMHAYKKAHGMQPVMGELDKPSKRARVYSNDDWPLIKEVIAARPNDVEKTA